MEEGADIPDGVTMRHATQQLLGVLKKYTKDVPADKEVKAAYDKRYSLQTQYAGVEINYLEIFLMMLPLIQAQGYQEQQEEYMNNPSGSEAQKVRAFGGKGGGTGTGAWTPGFLLYAAGYRKIVGGITGEAIRRFRKLRCAPD